MVHGRNFGKKRKNCERAIGGAKGPPLTAGRTVGGGDRLIYDFWELADAETGGEAAAGIGRAAVAPDAGVTNAVHAAGGVPVEGTQPPIVGGAGLSICFIVVL